MIGINILTVRNLYFCALMKKAFIFLLVLILGNAMVAAAQQKHITTKQQVWLGYMSSGMIAKKWSLWNDFHYVNNGGFFVARTGITYQLPQTAITAGYALLLLPMNSSNNKLARKEHRPWAQVVFSTPLAGNFSLTNRIRYDARFKQEAVDGKLTDNYLFNHRLRFQTTVRKSLPKLKWGKQVPFVNVGNEVLINIGKNIHYNTFDQYRFSFMVGVQKGNIQYMTGYMQRYVLSGYNKTTDVFDYTANHSLAIWVIQKLDLRKLKHAHQHNNLHQSAD
jgi:hypothetical protein